MSRPSLFSLLTMVLLAAPAVRASNNFTATGLLDIPREQHAAALMANGKVLLAGGSDGEFALSSALVYDLGTAKWTAAAAMSTEREHTTATPLTNGLVLLAGGFGLGNTSLTTAELYDPAANTWTATGSLAQTRHDHTATVLANGKVLVVGGASWEGGYHVLATAELYDPVAGTWSSAGTLSTPRVAHTATLLTSGLVLVTGGNFYDGKTKTVGTAELYDPATNAWTLTGAMKTVRSSHCAALLPNGKVLVAGGINFLLANGLGSHINAAELYDPSTGKWTATGAMKLVRFNHTATVLANGKVLIAGGAGTAAGPAANGELYDVPTGTWSGTIAMTAGHYLHTATLLTTGKVLIAGGEAKNFALTAVTEIYAPGQVSGTFNGLVTAQNGTTPGLGTEGFFNATVMDTGAFTGKLAFDGDTLSVAGSFDDTTGDARFGTALSTTLTLIRPTKPALTVALHRDLSAIGADNMITGTVTRYDRTKSATVSQISTDRAYYDGLSPATTVPAAYLTATGTTGLFNVILPMRPLAQQPAVLTTADYPQGTGFGTVKITPGGAVTCAFILADGTGVTAAVPLARHSIAPQISFPLFAQLYSKLGYLSATVTLDSTAADTDLRTTKPGVDWYRSYLTTQYYPYGWPEVISTDLLGAKFTVTAGKSVLRATNNSDLLPAAPNGNADLDFDNAGLLTTVIRPVNVAATDVVTKTDLSDKGYSLTINHNSGQFSGSFTHTDGTKPAFQGIIYQKGAPAGGYGYFLTPLPKVIDYTGQSGTVTLTAH